VSDRPATSDRPAASTRDWDADTYHRVAGPQEEWGREVLDRLPLRGDETVLDAGCGSGRVTRLLIERLPRGRVIAVDGAPSMVARARETLGPDMTVVESDLLELYLEEPVDAVFSTAVFHHIHDHDRLFARMCGVLRPGGRLVAQCGGEGNVARFRAQVDIVAERDPYARHLRGMPPPWYYASPGDTERRLREAGFAHARCWLEPRPTEPADPAGFLRTVLLNYHVERLPAELVDPFVADVLRACGEPLEVDYVRLNIDARAA
jgi:trans-aconitate 2-methyltransferase